MDKKADQMLPPKTDMVSALADGHLQGASLCQCLDWLAEDEQACADWHVYHVIGDVLRSSDLAVHAGDVAFVTRFRARLAAEGAAPARLDPDPVHVVHAVSQPAPEAANDSVFRWKLVAGLASVAAVAAIGWSVIGLPGSGASAGAGAQMATATEPATMPAQTLLSTVPAVSTARNEPAPAMLRDPRLDEFLAAHREMAGTSALEGAGSFMRSASFERAAR